MQLEVIPAAAQPVATIAAPTAATPAMLLQHAMTLGDANLDRLERLMQMDIAWQANEARKAYVDAMAQFKRNPPTIIKDKLVGYKNKDGSVTGYQHATLGAVTEAIVASLAEHGFSHRWQINQDGGQIKVTCILTHKQGHSEETPMSCGKDDSGKKNAIQQVASAITYLQRYTLLAATGVATMDQSDDDGKGFTTDTTLADEWIAKLALCKTDAECINVWNVGAAAILEKKDTIAYDEFKEAVATRRGEVA